MKNLEKTVHFVAEGTSIGCYDSKGTPIMYIMIEGVPYIQLDYSVDRLFNVPSAAVHNTYQEYCKNHTRDSFACVDLSGVINKKFISSKCSFWTYAERPCTNRELASFYLAKYKAQKNAIKL